MLRAAMLVTFVQHEGPVPDWTADAVVDTPTRQADQGTRLVLEQRSVLGQQQLCLSECLFVLPLTCASSQTPFYSWFQCTNRKSDDDLTMSMGSPFRKGKMCSVSRLRWHHRDSRCTPISDDTFPMNKRTAATAENYRFRGVHLDRSLDRTQSTVPFAPSADRVQVSLVYVFKLNLHVAVACVCLNVVCVGRKLRVTLARLPFLSYYVFELCLLCNSSEELLGASTI